MRILDLSTSRLSRSKLSKLALGAGFAVVAVVILGFLGEGEIRAWRAKQRVPRIVLVTLDTLNLRYTAPWGAPEELTPVLAEMARQGVRFEWTHGPAPLTLPAHTTLLSGVGPEVSGVLVNGDRVPERLVTLPEILRQAGYRTAAFISLGVLKPEFGLSQGFEHYDGSFEGLSGRWYKTADEVVPAAQSWVEEAGEAPFFLWVHLSDTHEPRISKQAPPDTEIFLGERSLRRVTLARRELTKLSFQLPPGRSELRWVSLGSYPSEHRRRGGLRLELRDIAEIEDFAPQVPVGEEVALSPSFSIDLENGGAQAREVTIHFSGRLVESARKAARGRYRREVTRMDHWLGELRDTFRRRGIFDDTLWVVVSDHGEGMFFHGIGGHAAATFEDQLRIAWLMEGPGLPRGRTVPDPVRMQDITPTLLDVLGLEAPAELAGVSREPCLKGGDCAPPELWWAYGIDAESHRLSSLAGYRWPVKWVEWVDESRSPAAFQLLEDPWEEASLLRQRNAPRGDLRELRREALDQRARFEALLGERLERSAENDEDEAMLRSLGY